MDIFDRLGDLIRTILDDDPVDSSQRAGGRTTFGNDPDMRRAWEELEDYMNQENPSQKRASGPGQASSSPAEALRKDFRNLEVPFGASMEEVRKSYKRLMAAFHPDRHSADPERFKTATEVTKKLNQSFERVKTYYQVTGKPAD